MPQPYQRFARHYHEGHYTQFARWVSETVFPHFQQVLSSARHGPGYLPADAGDCP
jgi:hypothetical protein